MNEIIVDGLKFYVMPQVIIHGPINHAFLRPQNIDSDNSSVLRIEKADDTTLNLLSEAGFIFDDCRDET